MFLVFGLEPAVYAQNYPEPNYIAPIANRPLDKTKPTVTLAGEVNIANGAANYTLPIAVPAGIQGVQPNLAISYNSNGGNGQLGLGWALVGASAFSRGGSSHFLDGQVAPVTLTDDDNLFLDGQRLVPYGTSSSFGATAEYRTLTKSYQKIEFIDNDVIKVTQKDGITRYYGGTNARLRLTNPSTQTDVTYSWFLFKVEDRNGNYMTYNYTVDATKNQVTLDNISYTANDAAGISAKTEVQFGYTMRTDERSGYLLSNMLHNGLLLHTITVMHNNTQYSKYTLNYMFDQTPKLGNDFSKLVEIQYQAQTKELNSVVVRWPIQQNEYALTNNISGSQFVDYDLSQFHDYGTKKTLGQTITGDFNGDGRTDIIILKHKPIKQPYCWVGTDKRRMTEHDFDIVGLFAQNTSPQTFDQVTIKSNIRSNLKYRECEREGFARIYSGDFNGDGLLDLLLHRSEVKSSYRYNEFYADIYLNQQHSPGSFDFHSTIFTPNLASCSNNSIANLNCHNYSFTGSPFNLVVADLDGNGLTDIAFTTEFVVTNYVNQTTSTFGLNARFFEENMVMTNGKFPISGLGSLDSIYPGEFNGDGIVDFLMTDGGTSSKIVTFANQQLTEIWAGGFPNGYHYILLGDYNGDGITDVLINNSSNQWLLNYFTGTAFTWPHIDLTNTFNTVLTKHFVNSRPQKLDKLPWVKALDADADGRTDIVFADKTEIKVFYNKITGWEHSNTPVNSINTISNIGYTNKYQFSLHIVDFIGDGSANLFYAVPFRDKSFYLDFRPQDQSHRISSILDGANTLSTFTYKPLTDNGIYARGNTEDYPNPVITAPLHVVSNLEQELFDGTAITDQSYTYEAARVNSLGLGLLGFEKITTTDAIQGRRSVSTFALPTTQLPQYKTQPMLPQKMEVFSAATNTLLTSTEYTYYGTVVQTATGITPWQYNPQVWEEKSKDFVHGTSAKTSYIYDNFGNISSTLSHTYNNNNFTAPYLSRTEEVASYSFNNGSWLNWLPDVVTTTVTRHGQTPAIKTTSFNYDGKGNLTQKMDYPGEEVEVITDYTYFNTGNLKDETITPFGMAPRTSSYTYTADGRFLETEKNTLNWVVEYEYDDLLGVRTKQTDFNNLVTEWEYDEFGRVTKETAPDGTELNTSYAFFNGQNATLLFTTVTTGTVIPPVEDYADGLGRTRLKRTKNRNDDWVAVRTDFDSRGRQYRSCQPYFPGNTPLWNTTTFDDNNRPLTITAATGKSMSYTYNGRTTTVTNTYTNQSSSKTVDADGLTVTATDAGGSINYTYNSFGQPISVTGPSGTPITSTFDAYGRQTQLNDPAAGLMTYKYDALGQLTEQTDNAGNTYTMQYDDLGRITQKTGPEGTYTYTYDGVFKGKLDSRTAPNGIAFTTQYDVLGRKGLYEELIDGQVYAFHYTYTTDGQLESMTYPNNFGVNYIYDNNGYTTGMTRTDNGEQIWSFGEENRFGQLTDYTLGNDIQMALEYDAISGLPTSIDNGQNWGMSYDFDVHTGNLNSRGHLYNGLTEDFQYDNLDRLTNYNTATNPLTVTYASTGSITFKGDAGGYTNHQPTGRTTSVDHESSATGFEISHVTQNITYTAFNSVETIVEGAYEAFFTYGPDQQRSKMLINHHGSTYIERMYMAGGQYERDHLPDGSWRNLTYITTPAGLSAVFIQNEGSQEEEFYFIHTDYQGSIMALTDYNGQLLEEYSYDPWGNRRYPETWENMYTNTTNPTAGQSGSQSLLWGVGGALFRGYTFHEHLDCFALINMNGRMYDPVLGRMLSADNYMHSGTQGLNRYAYVYNNPLKYTDPSGEIIHLAVGAMIGGIANTLSNAKNINSFGDGLMYFGIGAVGGAIGAGIGAGIVSTVAGGKFMAGFIGASQSISATAASYSSFANGFLSGFSGGFSGGFVSGLGNSLYSGDNFGQAIKSGLRAGFVAGVSSGFIGGLIGGFHAVNDGRRFSDGATVYKLKSEVSGITNVTQSNPNNCLPANGELASNSLGDNVSQHDGRNWFGGSGPINDEEFWLEYANQTGRSIERLSSSQDPVYELMRLIDDGYRVSISVPGENGIGHAVFLKSYSRKIVLKLNYDVIVSDKIVVWNPGISNINNQITSGFQNFSTTDIRTAWNIWLIK